MSFLRTATQRSFPLLVLLLLSGASQAAVLRNFEGETGSSYTCSGMQATPTSGAHNDSTLYYPQDGCSASFDVGGAGQVVTVEFYVGGAASVCGRFSFSGASVGITAAGCYTSGVRYAVTASTTAGSGSTLVVTWQVDAPSPSSADAYLDRFSYLS